MVRPAGFEPTTPGLGTDCSGAVSHATKGLATPPLAGSADSTALAPREAASECEEMRSDQAELELVVRAWDDLAPPLKAAILAMVRAASEEHAP